MSKQIFLLSIFIIYLLNNSSAQHYWKPIFFSDDTSWADSILATLSEEERIAQLFMVSAYSNKDDIHKEHVSSLIKKYKIG